VCTHTHTHTRVTRTRSATPIGTIIAVSSVINKNRLQRMINNSLHANCFSDGVLHRRRAFTNRINAVYGAVDNNIGLVFQKGPGRTTTYYYRVRSEYRVTGPGEWYIWYMCSSVIVQHITRKDFPRITIYCAYYLHFAESMQMYTVGRQSRRI